MIAANAGGRIAIAADDVGRERLAKGRARAHPQRGHQRLRAGDGERRPARRRRRAFGDGGETADRSQGGLLEFESVDIDLDDVGGLQNLKRWLRKRDGSWLAEAAEYGVSAPKGVLMTVCPAAESR